MSLCPICAKQYAPDAPPLLVWVYPFDEYSSELTEQGVGAMYFEDWYIRGAINQGMPVSAVTSTDSFIKHSSDLYKAGVLLTPVPKKGSKAAEKLLEYGKNGGKIIFYGNAKQADKEFMDVFGLKNEEPHSGEMSITVDGRKCGVIKHEAVLSGGGLSQTGKGFAYADDRVVGVQSGFIVWIRGTVSCDFKEGSPLLRPHDENRYFAAEQLLRTDLGKTGYEIVFEKPCPSAKSPVMTISRSNGAYMFSVYSKTAAVKTKLKFPQGTPILPDFETMLEDGYASYYFPKAAHCECRVFVVQQSGLVGAEEFSPVSSKFRRRIIVKGLKNATVRILGENYCRDNLTVVCNSGGDYCAGEPFDGAYTEINGEIYFEVRNVTGSLVISMPLKESR